MLFFFTQHTSRGGGVWWVNLSFIYRYFIYYISIDEDRIHADCTAEGGEDADEVPGAFFVLDACER